MRPYHLLLSLSMLILISCSAPPKEAPQTEISDQKSLVGYVDLTNPMDEAMIKEGTKIFTMKCAKCHTVDTVQFTVPAFAGVTNRRAPEWIMNMIINVEEMLKQDPVAADLLREHKRVMPDPNLDVAQARAVLEFLRANDMEQLGEKDQAAAK